MFAAQYCVTPTKRPGMRLPDRAATFLRDVKRRSLRVKRSKSLVINPPGEKRVSGKRKHNSLFLVKWLCTQKLCRSRILIEKVLEYELLSLHINYSSA